MKKTERNNKGIEIYWKVIFVIYIIILSYMLFFSERYGRINGNEKYRYNLVLFNEINRFIKYRKTLGFEKVAVNLIGNIFAFAPFGFFLPILNRKLEKFYIVILLSGLFSLTVETIQLYSRVGIFDVDDILLNTIGGFVGYIIFKIFRRKLVQDEDKKKNTH